MSSILIYHHSFFTYIEWLGLFADNNPNADELGSFYGVAMLCPISA